MKIQFSPLQWAIILCAAVVIIAAISSYGRNSLEVGAIFAHVTFICLGILAFGTLGEYSASKKQPDNPEQLEWAESITKRDNVELSKLWFKKGLELSALNEYEKSLNAYNKALTFNDKDPDTWNNKSYVLIRLKKYDEAIKAGRIAVDLAPNDPEIQDTLNEAYKASKNQV
jgi:tetratricopeptide (TPR) repeat protein